MIEEDEIETALQQIKANMHPIKIVAKISVGVLAFPVITTLFIIGFFYTLGENLIEEMQS